MIRNIAVHLRLLSSIAIASMLASPIARADAVTSWNRVAGDIIVDAGGAAPG